MAVSLFSVQPCMCLTEDFVHHKACFCKNQALSSYGKIFTFQFSLYHA